MLCTNATSGVSYSILWKTFLRLSYIFGDQLFQGSLYCYGCYLPPNWLMTFKAREWDGWVFGKIPSTESPKCSWSLGFQLGQFHLLVPPVDLQENSQSRNREHLLKIHIKSTRRCHRKPNRRAIINISMNNKRQRGCGEKGTLCWRGCELTQPLWKTVWGFLKKTRIKPPKREVQILRINAHKESIKMGLMSLFAGHQWRHTHREQTCGHGGGKVKVGSMQRITSACNVGDAGSTPGSGKPPRGGSGNPLQYSCLENPMDRPWGHKKLDTTEQPTLSLYLWKRWGKGTHTHTRIHICFLLWTPNSYVEV